MKIRQLLRFFTLSVFLLLLSSCATTPANTEMAADDQDKVAAQQLADKTRFTLDNFMKNPNMRAMREYLKKAKGVFITPQLLRGAFIVGASGGSGIFLQRNSDNRWTGPAFYTVGGASFGLQAGGEDSEVILVIMTDRGVAAFQSSNIILLHDAGITVGPMGAGVTAQNANLSADILSFFQI